MVAFVADLVVFVALPGWDTSGEIVSGTTLYVGFTVLVVLSWMAGLLAFVLFRLVRASWLRRTGGAAAVADRHGPAGD
jgi:hypothetical protein